MRLLDSDERRLRACRGVLSCGLRDTVALRTDLALLAREIPRSVAES